MDIKILFPKGTKVRYTEEWFKKSKRRKQRTGIVIGWSLDRKCVRVNLDGDSINSVHSFYNSFVEIY